MLKQNLEAKHLLSVLLILSLFLLLMLFQYCSHYIQFFKIFYLVSPLSTLPLAPPPLKRPRSRYAVCFTESKELSSVSSGKSSPVPKLSFPKPQINPPEFQYVDHYETLISNQQSVPHQHHLSYLLHIQVKLQYNKNLTKLHPPPKYPINIKQV